MGELAWLGAVRHAESVGNVAAVLAEGSGAQRLDLAPRDPDVPLSDLGRDQAAATRGWLAGVPRPDLVLVSPYLRTTETAKAMTDGLDVRLSFDERLRDRELGILDLLTARGVQQLHPTEAERRQRLGKFYYRPPGGESWADVALRIRMLLSDLRRDHDGRRVLLVTHDVVVQIIRYLVEDLDEARLLDLSRAEAIVNTSVSTWARDGAGRLMPQLFNDVAHLRARDTKPTREEGLRAEPV